MSPTFADLHWKITNKNLNEDLFETNIISSTPMKQQKRNHVKNAKLVFALKKISFVEFGHHSPIFQLQKRIITKSEKRIPEWEQIRTFKLPKPGKIRFVVIGVKSLVRNYLRVSIKHNSKSC